MTKVLGSFALAAMTFAVAPQTVLAYEVPFQASFVVAYSVTPNSPPVAYCGGTPLDLAVEAHGAGSSNTLGALSLSLQKTVAASGPAMHGCLTLSTPDGDSLFATYDGTEGDTNANNFTVTSSGTLAFTGGTGRFKGAKGKATFTGVFCDTYPGSSFAAGGANTAPLQGMAFYLIEGKVSVGGVYY